MGDSSPVTPLHVQRTMGSIWHGEHSLKSFLHFTSRAHTNLVFLLILRPFLLKSFLLSSSLSPNLLILDLRPCGSFLSTCTPLMISFSHMALSSHLKGDDSQSYASSPRFPPWTPDVLTIPLPAQCWHTNKQMWCIPNWLPNMPFYLHPWSFHILPYLGKRQFHSSLRSKTLDSFLTPLFLLHHISNLPANLIGSNFNP